MTAYFMLHKDIRNIVNICAFNKYERNIRLDMYLLSAVLYACEYKLGINNDQYEII